MYLILYYEVFEQSSPNFHILRIFSYHILSVDNVDSNFLCFPHVHCFFDLSTLMYLYRKKHHSFYFSLTNVTNNFHKRQRQKKHILNSLFMLFYYCGQNIYSFYSYKHFMHKLWINHNIPTDLSTKLSTIVKNSTIMPTFRVIHNIHKVFHNYAILCGLMFIIIFTNDYYSSTCYSLMFITLSLYFILI